MANLLSRSQTYSSSRRFSALACVASFSETVNRGSVITVAAAIGEVFSPRRAAECSKSWAITAHLSRVFAAHWQAEDHRRAEARLGQSCNYKALIFSCGTRGE